MDLANRCRRPLGREVRDPLLYVGVPDLRHLDLSPARNDVDVEDAAITRLRGRLELHLHLEPPLGPDRDGDFPRPRVDVRAGQLARLDLGESPLGVALESECLGTFPAGLRIDVAQAPEHGARRPVVVHALPLLHIRRRRRRRGR